MTDGPVDHAGRRPGSVMARLNEPRTAEPTRVAVVADPHVSTREEGTMKLLHRTREHLELAVEDIRGRDVDAVLSVGDLTKDGERWNYGAVDEVLAGLDAPFMAVPGNHDVPKERDDHDALPVEAFAERYAPGGEFPFHAEVGGLDVIGLNSSGTADRLYDEHAGAVPEAHLDWLADTLPGTQAPVVLLHHNLPAMMAQYDEYREAVEPDMFVPGGLENGGELVEVLSAHGASLVLTGHLHMPNAAAMDGVRELQVPTTCAYPQAYALLDVDETGATVRMVPVVDTPGMREGHTGRLEDSVTSKSLTAMAAIRVAQFPLVDEAGGDGAATR